MARHFASVFLVLLVVLAGRGVLGHGTPQPEQIHISSTGSENDCNLAHCLTLHFIGLCIVIE